MKENKEFDAILADLAKPFGRRVDVLLDLREWVADPSKAGSCIRAYFELLAESPGTCEVVNALKRLKTWLEQRLDILVLDAGKSVCLEKLPLALDDGRDLSEFCHRKMSFVRNDRCHRARDIRLEFSFQERAAAH